MKSKNSKSIGWIDGKWNSINKLTLPLNDRGTTFGDGIFETILILNGKPQLLNNHLERWEKSAALLAMESPPTKQWLLPLINEAILRNNLNNRNCAGALRLNWSRGDRANRKINLELNQSDKNKCRFWLELNPISISFNSISTIISQYEQRNAKSLVSQCKVFNYTQSIMARNEANLVGSDDALLLSTNGEISCGTTANLIVKRNNQWLTPHLKSGCLPGIMRQQGINAGIIKETELKEKPQEGDEWMLINSLSCHPISKINNQNMQISIEAKQLWSLLLVN